jgi:hypothetical protein
MRRARWLVFLLLLPLFLIDGGLPAPAQVFPTSRAPIKYPQTIFPIGRFPAPAVSPLIGFPTNFWKLDSLNDEIGSLTLTNSATPVTFTAGKIGNAGTFVRASSEFLSRGAATFTGPSFTLWAWFKSTDTNYKYIFDWNAIGGGQVALVVNFPSAGTGKVTFSTDLNIAPRVDSAASTYNDGGWHLAVAYHDSGTGNNVLILDNGTPVTTGSTSNVASATAALNIGEYTGGGIYYYDGQIDAVMVADNKKPTAAQITAAWNSGFGVEYPF